jgi:tRNA-Thr(GGU) m(6)t(6)A37 methyltransferase TsaA
MNMTSKEIIFRPIGIINTPFQLPEGMPIQPSAAEGEKGSVVLDPEYQSGLDDLEGFSHIVLLYFFHRAGEYNLKLKPFLDDVKRGVFATRAPRRPNGIGISVVELVNVSGNILEIQNVDMLDGTPLLDIKPYVPDFDQIDEVRIGWLEKARGSMRGKMADDRFSD